MSQGRRVRVRARPTRSSASQTQQLKPPSTSGRLRLVVFVIRERRTALRLRLRLAAPFTDPTAAAFQFAFGDSWPHQSRWGRSESVLNRTRRHPSSPAGDASTSSGRAGIILRADRDGDHLGLPLPAGLRSLPLSGSSRRHCKRPLRYDVLRSAASILKEGDARARLGSESPGVGGNRRFPGPLDVWNPTVQRLHELLQRS